MCLQKGAPKLPTKGPCNEFHQRGYNNPVNWGMGTASTASINMTSASSTTNWVTIPFNTTTSASGSLNGTYTVAMS